MDYWWDILNLVLIFSIFSISLNLLVGYAGQVSVAQAAFGAVGGYLAAYLATNAGVSFLPGLAIGATAAGVVGIFVSLPALRLSAEYLILLTIAVSSIVLSIVGAVPALGGNYGLVATKPADLSPLPGGQLLFPSSWIVPLLVATVLTYLVCWRMGESAWGRVLRGIRDDDVATRALGHNVFAYKLAVFGITAAFAGFAGVLLFYYNQLASPDVYGFNVSLEIFAMVIFGGLGNFTGSILGAAVLELLQPLLEKVVQIEPTKSFLVQLVIYGVGLVVLMRLRPQGLLPEGASLLHPFRRTRGAPPDQLSLTSLPPAVNLASGGGVLNDGPREPLAPSELAASELLLEVRHLEKRFGGIAACRDLDIDLRRGQITALVGPNGAGKTTVFNLLTGTARADAGSVRLRGEEVRGLTPDAIARRGMGRTFQDVRLFSRLTALQNVMLGVRYPSGDWWRWPSGSRGGQNLYDLFVRPDISARVDREAREQAMHWLETVGLARVADVPAASLAFGQQKLVSLARLLATDADVLLLDEPASGIDTRWVDAVLELVSFIRTQGKTICIVEHSLHVVEQLADTVFFMELGRITASGSIDELTSDERLAEVYFGTV
jgi:branched-chain amino acid transport system ATP-binding protein/branched-chain amino acid transport system permease protein